MRLLPVLAVELRPEETRCALEYFVGSAKLADLLLELPHAPGLDGRHAGDVTLIDVGLLDPRPHRLDAVSELRRDALHRPMLGPQLGPQRSHHPDRGGLLLRDCTVNGVTPIKEEHDEQAG